MSKVKAPGGSRRKAKPYRLAYDVSSGRSMKLSEVQQADLVIRDNRVVKDRYGANRELDPREKRLLLAQCEEVRR